MGPRLVSRGEFMSCVYFMFSSCFNGAAACEPRRVPAIGEGETLSPASMGPRLVSRGEGSIILA